MTEYRCVEMMQTDAAGRAWMAYPTNKNQEFTGKNICRAQWHVVSDGCETPVAKRCECRKPDLHVQTYLLLLHPVGAENGVL